MIKVGSISLNTNIGNHASAPPEGRCPTSIHVVRSIMYFPNIARNTLETSGALSAHVWQQVLLYVFDTHICLEPLGGLKNLHTVFMFGDLMNTFQSSSTIFAIEFVGVLVASV